MVGYFPRVADLKLGDLMRAVGAVLIEDPKACGKSETASRVAATKFEMDVDVTARASIELNPDPRSTRRYQSGAAEPHGSM